MYLLHGKGLLPENSSDLKLTFFANGFEHVPYTASSPLTKAALNKEFAGAAISTWVWQGATLPLKRETVFLKFDISSQHHYWKFMYGKLQNESNL